MRSRATQFSPVPDVSDTTRIYAQAKDENFPVASFILPASIRRHLMAVYGVARLIDDIGDEAHGDRSAALDWLEAQLHAAKNGEATDPVVSRLTPTLSEGVSLQHFLDLVAANRQDQVVHRYDNFQGLVGYCYLSAAPVGRIVLEVLGLSTPERVALSDDVCIGLQVVEHLQDVKEDLGQDRIYLPLVDLKYIGALENDLHHESASDSLRRCIEMQAKRARELLGSGVPLARTLPLRARIAICGFTAGGEAALDAIEAAHFDVLAVFAKPRALRVLRNLVINLVRSYRKPAQ